MVYSLYEGKIMAERRDIQKTVLEYLASRWEDDKIITTAEIREKLSLSIEQMKQAKGCLVSKGLAIDHGRGYIGLKKNLTSKDFVCKLLTKKSDEFRKDEPYCPLKKTYIAEKDKYHFCGKLLHVRFIGEEPELYWRPNCENWSGKK
jgi:hypothetical protein